METPVSLDDIAALIEQLRHPNEGCPWVLQQSFESIIGASVEEMYELVDAILARDFEHVQQELGDVLLQVVFYCQFAKEQQRFSMDDVLQSLQQKLIRRHPHVFTDARQNQAITNLDKQWQAIKVSERKQLNDTSILADIPKALPALKRAQKLQKRTSHVGFDWPNVASVMAKVQEELAELDEAIASKNSKNIEMELGDVLFSVVNLARFLEVDAEQALMKSNQKFTNRFVFIENALKAQNVNLEAATVAQLEALWQQAKIDLSD